MKKIKYLALSWCLGLTLQFFFSCTNEDNTFITNVTGLETSADLLKLVDDGTNIAGELSITSDIPNVKLVWNTNEACNLDTTLSSITLKNGRYTLPIKWQKSISDGKFGPEGIAYKAGVQILAGKYSKYVPLIWAEKIDTTKVMESIPSTRAAESIIPKLVQIELTPTTAFMNETIGASVHVGLKNADFVVFDWSEFNSDIHIDMSLLPNYITSSQFINFKWTSNGAPSYGFTVNYYAHTEGITQPGAVRYDPPAPVGPYSVFFRAGTGGTVSKTIGSGELNTIVSSTAIPNEGYSFYAWFTSANTIATTNPTRSVLLNEHTNKSTHEARFIYGKDYIECAGTKWSRGNLQLRFGVFSFMDGQELGSSLLESDAQNFDRFAFNTYLPPIAFGTHKGDPCARVEPEGTWRTPTSAEFCELQGCRYTYGYCNGVYGIYFGVTSPPSGELQSSTLFMPMHPYRDGIINKYWSSTAVDDLDGVGFIVTDYDGGFVIHHSYNNKNHIRCVKNN